MSKIKYNTTRRRPRDSQHAKINECCFALDLYRNSPNTNQEITDFIMEIVGSRWWNLRSVVRREDIIVSFSSSTRQCNPTEYYGPGRYGAGRNLWRIKTDSNTTKVDVLHTLAHFLHEPDTAWHGREFARALLDLFVKYMTKDEVKELRKEYRERKIRTYAWTAEAKAGATERYVAKQYPKAEEGLLNIMRELEAKGVTAE